MKHFFPSFYKYRPLKQSEIKNLVLVSVIFIVNIVLSNSSLKYNSLALDQVSSGSFLKQRCSVAQCQCLRVLWSSSSMVPFIPWAFICLWFRSSWEQCLCVPVTSMELHLVLPFSLSVVLSHLWRALSPSISFLERSPLAHSSCFILSLSTTPLMHRIVH